MTWELLIDAPDGIIAQVMCAQHRLEGPVTTTEGPRYVHARVYGSAARVERWLAEPRSALVSATPVESFHSGVSGNWRAP